MSWIKAAELADVPAGKLLQVKVDGRELVLAHAEDGVRAMDGICPHAKAPLGHGALIGHAVACPWHAWEFDCRSGEYDMDPALKLRTYPVKLEDGAILVEIE